MSTTEGQSSKAKRTPLPSEAPSSRRRRTLLPTEAMSSTEGHPVKAKRTSLTSEAPSGGRRRTLLPTEALSSTDPQSFQAKRSPPLSEAPSGSHPATFKPIEHSKKILSRLSDLDIDSKILKDQPEWLQADVSEILGTEVTDSDQKDFLRYFRGSVVSEGKEVDGGCLDHAESFTTNLMSEALGRDFNSVEISDELRNILKNRFLLNLRNISGCKTLTVPEKDPIKKLLERSGTAMRKTVRDFWYLKFALPSASSKSPEDWYMRHFNPVPEDSQPKICAFMAMISAREAWGAYRKSEDVSEAAKLKSKALFLWDRFTTKHRGNLGLPPVPSNDVDCFAGEVEKIRSHNGLFDEYTGKDEWRLASRGLVVPAPQQATIPWTKAGRELSDHLKAQLNTGVLRLTSATTAVPRGAGSC